MAAIVISIGAQIGTGLVAAGLTVTTAAWVGYIAANAIIIAGAKALTGALTPDIPSGGDFDSRSNGILLNKRANNAPIPVVYGTRLVGGTIVFLSTATDPSYVYANLVVSEGEIEDYIDIFYNDKPSTNSEFPPITSVAKYFGTQSQLGDSVISNDLSYYSQSEHRLAGTAYLRLRFKHAPEVFGSNLPATTTLIKGVKLFDPRSNLTEWSDNPALCIRDYLTNTRYGRGIETSLIDDTSFIISANYCDEAITIDETIKKRYTCDGVVSTENRSLDILNELLTSCKGFLIFSGGKYKLIIDKPEIASFTFSEDNIIGSWNITLGNKNTMFNRIRANFFNKDKEYQPDIVVIDSPTLRAQDDGVLLEKTIDLPYTSDIARAKMITTMNLNQSRQSITCEFNATIEGMLAEVGDVVYIKHDTPGWSDLNEGKGKKFRVMKIVLKNTDEVIIQATEYDLSAFSYDDIEVLDASPDTSLPDLSFISAPIDLIAYEERYTTTNSAGIKSSLKISWSAGAAYYLSHYLVRYKLKESTDWVQLSDNTKNTEATILDIDPGIYTIQVRAVNTVGVLSEWTELNNVIAIGPVVPPVDVSNLTATIGSTVITLAWDLATDVDVLSGGTVVFKHSSALTGATWNTSISITNVTAGSSSTTTLPIQAGTYLAKFKDSSGNMSINAASVVVETPVDIIDPPLKTTLTEHPTFAGIKTNMIVVNGELQLDNSTTGTYEFEAPANLGAIKVGRVSVHNILEAYLISDNIDDRLTLIDTWEDFDETPVDVIVKVYISTTNDNIAPIVWTPWTLFTPADYEAREVRFKLEVITSSLQNQISISELSATIAS